MHLAKTIHTLTLAALLAAGITLVSGSQGASAGQVNTIHPIINDKVVIHDHRSGKDVTTVTTQPRTTPPPSANVHGSFVTVFSNKHTVEGVRNDGTTIRTHVPATGQLVNHYNKDGSVDQIKEELQPNGRYKETVRQIRGPKHAELKGCGFFGLCIPGF